MLLSSMLRSGVGSFMTGVHAVHEGAVIDKTVGREASTSDDGDIVVAGMSFSCWS